MNRDSPGREVIDFNFFLCLNYDPQFVNIQLRKEDDSFMIEHNVCLLVRFNSTTLLTRAENLFRN
jgi:hypothetical protein